MLELRIALRYLFSRKTHNAVNVISLVSVGGVAVATMAIVIVLSVFNGFERLAYNQLSQLDAPLRIVPERGKVLAAGDSLANALHAAFPELKVMPVVKDQALAVVGNSQKPVEIVGVDDAWLGLSAIDSAIIDGEAVVSFGDMRGGVLSVGTALDLQTSPKEPRYLRIYAPRRAGRINTANPLTAFRGDSLFVAGVFQTGHAMHDDNMIIVGIDVARRLFDYEDESTSIELWGVAEEDAGNVKREVSKMLPVGCIVQDRMEQEGVEFRMIAIEKWITFAMLAFILLIASFNIVSTLCLLLIEKEGNISIMRAMGATQTRISRVFVYEGWLISLSGGVIGMILGVALVLAQQIGGFVKLGGDAERLIVSVYPVELRLSDLLAVMGIVAITGLVTAIFTTAFTRRRR